MLTVLEVARLLEQVFPNATLLASREILLRLGQRQSLPLEQNLVEFIQPTPFDWRAFLATQRHSGVGKKLGTMMARGVPSLSSLPHWGAPHTRK